MTQTFHENSFLCYLTRYTVEKIVHHAEIPKIGGIPVNLGLVGGGDTTHQGKQSSAA